MSLQTLRVGSGRGLTEFVPKLFNQACMASGSKRMRPWMRWHGILFCETQRYRVDDLMLSQAESSLVVSMMQIYRGSLSTPPVPLTWAARVTAGRPVKPTRLFEQIAVSVFPPSNAPDNFL